MMSEYKDITQISVSSVASSIADSMLESGYFKDKADVMTFAAAYMIKNHFTEFKPATYTLTDSLGTNLASSTFDPERKWHTVIQILYDDTVTPYIYLRALMDKGLLMIQQRLQDDPEFSIVNEI